MQKSESIWGIEESPRIKSYTLGNFRDLPEIQKLSEEVEPLKSLLFILPQDRVYLSIALHFLKTLMAKGSFDSVKRIIGFESYKDDFNAELKKKVEFITENDVNKYGLLNDEGLQKLTKGKFNAVINLDPEDNPISIQIVSQHSSKLRIGFGSNGIKGIYNISIENGRGNNYVERGYKYISKVLGL